MENHTVTVDKDDIEGYPHEEHVDLIAGPQHQAGSGWQRASHHEACEARPDRLRCGNAIGDDLARIGHQSPLTPSHAVIVTGATIARVSVTRPSLSRGCFTADAIGATSDNHHVAHHHPNAGDEPLLLQTVVLVILGTIALAGIEVAAGWRAGSLALVGDAGHLVTDAGSLALTGYALRRRQRRPTSRHTYGFFRSGILVAAVNGLGLLAVALVLGVAAVARLRHPPAVAGGTVVVVAGIATVVNLALARLLHRGHEDLHVRSARYHILADALASAGVVVAGAVILVTGWRPIDALVSLAIAAAIGWGALQLLRATSHILAEAAPVDIDPELVRRLIEAVPGVSDVHDLHIWSLDRSHRALSAHVTTPDRSVAETTILLRNVEIELCRRFGIEHATLQAEHPSCAVSAPPFCDLDERHQRAHRDESVHHPH